MNSRNNMILFVGPSHNNLDAKGLATGMLLETIRGNETKGTRQKMGIMKRLALLFFAGWLAGCQSQPPAAPAVTELPVLEVLPASATTYQLYPASLDGFIDVEVRPQVSGTLDRVYMDEGALVHAGDALFKINEASYRERLNNALASLHAAEAARDNAQLEVDKLTPLVTNRIVAEIQLRTAISSREAAVARIGQAQADVAAAKIDLGYTLIKAPVSGYIGRLPHKQGSLVSPGDAAPMTTLSDVHEIHAYFSMGEDEFTRFKSRYPGATLAEKIKHLPAAELVLPDDSIYTEKGRVELINGEFDRNTAAVTLRASFPNRNGFLRAGNTGKVRLSLDFVDQILVPQSATLELQDKVFVYKVGDSNKVSRQPIEIAAASGSNYLVAGGLRPRDKIVYKGFEHLHEGDIIQPKKIEFPVATITHP